MSFVGSAGLIGWPVAHSKSPLIHRFWLGKLGLDGDYGRFPVAPEDLGRVIRTLPALGLKGVNVTVPHKQAVMAFLDEIDAPAETIGAVNTIVVEDGTLVGYNTDGQGFMEPIFPLLSGSAAPPTALMIGAGGAARAIGHALVRAGFSVAVLNRDPHKALRLATELTRLPCDVPAFFDLANFPVPRIGKSADEAPGDQLLVNVTTSGMHGVPPLPISLAALDDHVIVYDIVYAPLETPLLAEARARGLRTIDGLQMLVGQAAAAFELFFGHPAPREHDAELRALLTA